MGEDINDHGSPTQVEASFDFLFSNASSHPSGWSGHHPQCPLLVTITVVFKTDTVTQLPGILFSSVWPCLSSVPISCMIAVLLGQYQTRHTSTFWFLKRVWTSSCRELQADGKLHNLALRRSWHL